ncbi:uncharacterized protein LOC134818144 [Bolinopsis microptera]|uniref:uncharacterized protein LOC134818144 n=1 Tax=Bolinopsis microptera TaxID=2820187 RepID=UPI00307A895F
MSSRLEKVKKQIELMEQFLDWSRKMKAKPSKCVSLGMKVIDGTYQAYDPEILIDGQIISYTVDECGLNGVMKCWIYNNMLTSKMSWDLMIYNLPVSKGHALKNSDDTKVVEAYNNKREKQENSPRWSYTTELTARERDLYFQELVGVVTKDRVGLGYKPKLTERQKLRQLVESVSENDMLVTLVNKGVQGKFLTWENTMQLDLGWNSLIYNYKMSPALLKFHLNSTHDVANTPANMKLWNYSSTGNCTLCGWKTCNIKHILAVCSVARKSKRYNWRHDNVLRVIAGALLDQLKMYNSSERPFERVKDWKLIWDEDTLPAQFPQHIYNTAERPDIVVWSDSLREVVLIELTCGDESNFSDQVARKEARYNRELIPGIDGCGWKALLFTVEIGCRGFWHHTVPALFNYFGLAKRTKNKALNEAALVALRCSYTIWLARDNKKWSTCYDIARRPEVINCES